MRIQNHNFAKQITRTIQSLQWINWKVCRLEDENQGWYCTQTRSESLLASSSLYEIGPTRRTIILRHTNEGIFQQIILRVVMIVDLVCAQDDEVKAHLSYFDIIS